MTSTCSMPTRRCATSPNNSNETFGGSRLELQALIDTEAKVVAAVHVTDRMRGSHATTEALEAGGLWE